VKTFSRGPLTFDVVDGGPPDGPPVILLHGFPETSASWADVVPGLHRHGFRTLAPDQRGYSRGARPKGRRSYSIAELVRDVVALADAAGAERFHLVGHDWGGIVAWHFASAHPERLLTVTSLSTPHPAAFQDSLLRSTQLLKSYYMFAFQLPGPRSDRCWPPTARPSAGRCRSRGSTTKPSPDTWRRCASRAR